VPDLVEMTAEQGAAFLYRANDGNTERNRRQGILIEAATAALEKPHRRIE